MSDVVTVGVGLDVVVDVDVVSMFVDVVVLSMVVDIIELPESSVAVLSSGGGGGVLLIDFPSKVSTILDKISFSCCPVVSICSRLSSGCCLI